MLFKEGYGRMVELVMGGVAAIPLLAILLAALVLSARITRLVAEGRPRGASVGALACAAMLAAWLLGIPIMVLLSHREPGVTAPMLVLLAVQAALWWGSAARADRAMLLHFHGTAAWQTNARWPFLLAWAAPSLILPGLVLLKG